VDLGLDGRTALVCASTGGLGRATAEALAAEGARVVVSGRRADLAGQIAAGLQGAVAVPVDVTAPGAAAELVDAARRELGADLDIVVLNGPGPKPAGATGIGEDDLRAALEALLVFHQGLVARVLPGMRERGWGRILAVGSSGVTEPLPSLALSNIGRSALAAYLKTLATEVAADGVTVNMLLPGRIDTDRVRSLDAARAEREGRDAADVAAASAAGIPAGRYGTPEEFGAVAAFLCSARASYVTGSAVRCDGGAVRHL
jgi:3-oxoacyl-[acyl-carrier protein] reductase